MTLEWCNEDGDHPSVAGYRRLGELAFRLLSHLVWRPWR
jgi:lysophospholipase L1-like esterase